MRLKLIALCTAIGTGAAAPYAHAEEATLLYGLTQADDHATQSYSWQFDYRQSLFRYTALSVGYVNEGHLVDHHRDGLEVQLWAVTPAWRERLSAAVGAGPYVYCDTQPTDVDPWFRDYHRVGEIYTGSLTYTLGKHWFARINVSQIHAPGDIDTRTFVVGGGYSFDAVLDRMSVALHQDVSQWSGRYANEINGFAGQTIVNANSSAKSTSFGLEYRRDLSTHWQTSATLLNEADGLDGRHNGLDAEIWLHQHAFTPRLDLGIGIGPYFALQSFRTEADGHEAGRVCGLVSMTVAWRLTERWLTRFVWSRSFTNDDQDRDVVTLGLGLLW
jgi:hypothetical protein